MLVKRNACKFNFSHVVILSILTFVFCCTGLLISLFTRIDKIGSNKLLESILAFDLYISSAYYYSESKSLGSHAVAIVFSGPREISQNFVMELINEKCEKVSAKVEQIAVTKNCEWIAYVAFVNFESPVKTLSVVNGNGIETKISVRQPRNTRRDVVVCMSPLYANEQWQLSIFAIHAYKHYGAHLHVYIRSMIDPLFKLYREYEKKGYLSIQGWPRMDIGFSTFNPNAKVEFRNQAAAQTDCLLQFKEAAEFITFLDLDDVLIPRLGSTFYEEFNYLFNAKPNAAYFTYPKNDASVATTQFGSQFHLSDFMSSIRFHKGGDIGKFFARPKTINHTWIHWPREIPAGMERENVPYQLNGLIHLNTLEARETVEVNGEPAKYSPRFDETLKDLLFKPTDFEMIRQDFESLASSKKIQRLLTRMPTEFLYRDTISKCFMKLVDLITSKKLECPHMEICEITNQTDSTCYNSKAEHSSTRGDYFNIHERIQNSFELEKSCIL